MPNIIKQDGSPVDEEHVEEEPTPAEDLRAIAEDVEGAVKELHRGAKKFSDGFLFKIGAIAVAIKVIDVIGKIIIEDRRLKSEEQHVQKD